MRIRRLILLVTSVFLGVLAATALLSPVPSVPEDGTVAQEPAAGEVQDPAQSPRAQDRHPEGEEPLVISAQGEGQVLSAPTGDQVIVEVRTDEPVAVQVGVDGVIEVAEPQSPAEFAVFVEEGLSAPITLVDSGRRIGRLDAEAGGSGG